MTVAAAARREVQALPATLRALLVAHIDRTGRRGEDLVFGREAGAPFTDSHLRAQAAAEADAEDVKRAKRKLPPLRRFGFHEARGFYRTYLSDIPELADVRCDRYMGHANTSMGARYTKHNREQFARDAQRIDAYLTGRASGKVVELAEAAAP